MSFGNLMKYTSMATELNSVKKTMHDMKLDGNGISRHCYSVGNLYEITKQTEKFERRVEETNNVSNNSCIDLRPVGKSLAVYVQASTSSGIIHRNGVQDDVYENLPKMNSRNMLSSDFDDTHEFMSNNWSPDSKVIKMVPDGDKTGAKQQGRREHIVHEHSCETPAENDTRYSYPTEDKFERKDSVSNDLRALTDMPELCDITFLVGSSKTPVYGVKGILATRNRSFYKLLTQVQSTPKKKTGSGLKPCWRKTCPNDDTSKQCIEIDEFESSVFKKLIDFLHTGCVQFTPDTALGLLNAAEHYGQEDLKTAATEYLEQCINLETVCMLLTFAQKYFHYKATKFIMQKILQFVAKYGESVLMLDQFASLPRDIISLVLSRDDLQARETTKLFVAVKWCRRYCLKNSDVSIGTAMSHFVDSIDFKQIPASVIMNDIKPLNIVNESILFDALAYKLRSESASSDLERKKSQRAAAKSASYRHPVSNANYSNVQPVSARAMSQRIPFYSGHAKRNDKSESNDKPPPLPPKSLSLSPRRRSSLTESTDSIESDSGMSSIDEAFLGTKGMNISYF